MRLADGVAVTVYLRLWVKFPHYKKENHDIKDRFLGKI